ncbi:uncharacterized protein TrAtP1_005573 [Trichoderma atroviride]|uniref:uncharacterized protein n=1 Tax=Hypocrea atroviridis TaxID=63577 RepID=UPI003332D257|nr:hypothetical protein TrAtP1_005573 [Trichoderma atroviride]
MPISNITNSESVVSSQPSKPVHLIAKAWSRESNLFHDSASGLSPPWLGSRLRSDI